MQKVDALMIGNELNGAGVKDGTLPASKLKTDVDADKIQLENLSDEVRANMSGQAAVTANTAAATADQATQTALDAAALAEDKAGLAVEKATLADQKATLAQTAKDHADQKAAFAQTQADYAKTQGDYGKAQGDYAKAQGDLAKGVVAGVIPNATQAASGLMSPADKTSVDNGQKFPLTNVTGSGKTITDSDLNKTITAGFYNVLLTDKNSPSDITGTLTVTTRASSVIMQSFQSQRNETFTRHSSDSGTTWTIWKKSTDENTLTNVVLGNKTTVQSNMNLTGKVTGSTTVSPHIAKVSTGIGVQTPQGFSVEFTQDRYNLLASLDSSHVVTSNPVAGVVSQHLISFNVIEHVQRTYGTIPGTTTAEKVAWLRANVTKLTFNWWGYGTGPAGNKANTRIWVFGAWQGATSTTNAASTKVSLGTSSSSYIQDDGFMHCLAYAEPSDGTTASVIYSDFAELLVEFSIDIKSNLLLNGVQGYKITADDGKSKLTNVSNLDTLFDTGEYYTAAGCIGIPEDGYYRVSVQNIEGNVRYQTVTKVSSSDVFVRSFALGTWRKWKRLNDRDSLISTLMGSSTTDSSIANFVGKISGSTTANPHFIGRRGIDTVLQPPTASWVELTNDNSNIGYQRVQQLDVYAVSQAGTTNGGIGSLLFSFNLIAHIERIYGTIPGADTVSKVAWLKSNVTKLVLNWYGYGSSPSGSKAYLTAWSKSSNSWVNTINHTQSTVNKLSSTIPVTSSTSAFDTDGMVHYATYADPSDGTTSSTIFTDYVELVVELSTNIKTNLLVQGLQGHKLTTDTGTAITPPNGTDFNTLYDTGYYVYSNDNTHKGSPNGYLYWLVEVTKYSASLSVQTWKGIVHDEVYTRRSVTGGWSPFRKNVDENILGNLALGNKPTWASTANFVGKTAGSNTGNPHKVTVSSASTLTPPNTAFEPTDIYTKVSALDGNLNTVPNGNANAMAQTIFSYDLIEHVQRTYGTIPGATTADKVTWLKNNVSRLIFNWWGYGSSPAGNRATFALWDTLGVWNAPTFHTNSVVQKASIISTQVNLRIDNNGHVHAIAYAEPSNGIVATTIYTDYAELQVELSTDIKTNLLLNGVQGYKLTKDDGQAFSVANGFDFDNAVSPGRYFANSTQHANLPYTYQFVDITTNGGDVTQVAHGVSGSGVLGMSYRQKPAGRSWQGWRLLIDKPSLISSLMGNSIADQSAMNFNGKISGSTTINPHGARRVAQATLITPPVGGTVDDNQSGYDGISSLNGTVTPAGGSTNTAIAQHHFAFNIIAHVERLYGAIPAIDTAGKATWLKANITKFTATWHGFGSGPAGNKAYLTRWDANAGAWLSTAVTGTTHTGASVQSLSFTPGVATSIDSSGFMHLLVYADASDGTIASVINTDFVEVKVDLDTSLKKNLAPVWIDAVLQNGWVDFTTAQKPKYSLGADGFVQLRGGVKDGTLGNATPIMTLPAGFRPAVNQYFSVPGYAQYVYRITVDTTGKVIAETASGGVTNTFIALDGIRFSIT